VWNDLPEMLIEAAWARAAPGREAAAQNEVLRAFSHVRLWANRTLNRHRGMTESDPLLPSAIQSSCVAVFLFDQLVRAQQDRCRHIETKRLGGRHIEHGLVFHRHLQGRSASFSLLRMRST